MNPGGSSKDRFAKALLTAIKSQGSESRIAEIVEGSSGSTGISMALLSKVFGYRCTIFMPMDQSAEKRHWLTLFGAKLSLVQPASFVNPEHYANMAEDYAKKHLDYCLYADQFENPLNWQAHYETTGPEIWAQSRGQITAVVLSSGTAGTLAGVSKYLKRDCDKSIKIVAADPPGSGIYGKVKYGTMWSPKEAEGQRRRNQVDSIVQGVGLNRITSLLHECMIDDAILVPDEETVAMAQYLLNVEGKPSFYTSSLDHFTYYFKRSFCW
jgi:cysteine synthase